jgi:hypothetical protein
VEAADVFLGRPLGLPADFVAGLAAPAALAGRPGPRFCTPDLRLAFAAAFFSADLSFLASAADLFLNQRDLNASMAIARSLSAFVAREALRSSTFAWALAATSAALAVFFAELRRALASASVFCADFTLSASEVTVSLAFAAEFLAVTERDFLALLALSVAFFRATASRSLFFVKASCALETAASALPPLQRCFVMALLLHASP